MIANMYNKPDNISVYTNDQWITPPPGVEIETGESITAAFAKSATNAQIAVSLVWELTLTPNTRKYIRNRCVQMVEK